jgi:formylglycine-generating enzyme required for sulfatase activity
MSDGDSLDPEQLRQAIAILEVQQQALKLDFTAQIVELQRRLARAEQIAQSGAGAIATTGGVSAGASGVAVAGDVHGNVITIHTSSTPQSLAELRKSYLHWLIAQVRSVPLSGVDPKGINEETRQDMDLAAVYTALMTQRPEAVTGHERHAEGESWRLSALAVLNAEPHLALLGDPGSGKSTFVNFVTLCLAGEILDRPEANLSVLRDPFTDATEARRRRSDASPPPQPSGHEPQHGKGEAQHRAPNEFPPPQLWDHGPLLPMRVVLRDFIARSLLPAGPSTHINGDTLWQFIVNEVPATIRDVAPALRDELVRKGGILLLDGLYEVPEADRLRVQVKAVVEEFVAMFPRVRVLVTSRTYAYQRQEWKLDGFAEAVLAPFGAAQIHGFVERWYAFVGQIRGLSAADAQGRAMLLNEAIRRNARLHELATRPLLLTLMASLHAWRGGILPEQREELYAEAVDLLLDQWERRKLRHHPNGRLEVIEPSLAEWLNTDHQAMRQVLNRLAFEAHRDQPSFVGTADIAQAGLVQALMALNPNPDAKPARLIEYLRDRAGLLEPRGVGVYAFPHCTFQEYLTACHLTDVGFPDELGALLRLEPNRWREVVLLAGAKAARGTTAAAWTLAETLCDDASPAEKLIEETGYWGALLAAQILIETRSLKPPIAERNRHKEERIRQWLVHMLQHGALSPMDRAQAGDALAILGDPRFRADAWYLPDEPLLGFVEIPAGPFLMGSDKERDPQTYEYESPQHEMTLPCYFIGRYPVTVAQFRKFGRGSSDRPAEKVSLDGLPNHPVVNVSWYDTLKYCEWLTKQLREWEGTPEPLATLVQREGWVVTLPSEAEWEKAARGIDGRIYAWGDKPDPNQNNYKDTGIGTTSAVGSFPGGASPYGVVDMSGNVGEWTRSLWGPDFPEPAFAYPYQQNDGRENQEAPDRILRVLRGGAFNDPRAGVRCVYRDRNRPIYRDGLDGFRVVVRPCS